jgi:prepilin-type N-terminal cleavage/methylation domain-containing protein
VKPVTLQLLRMRSQMKRAFTLVELMVVVALLAILATLVAPSLANASAPLPQTIISTLEIDMRRASIEAIGRLEPVSVVLSRDRTRWWIATAARPDEPIAGTTRILGNGSLQPFKGYTLAVTMNGEDPSLDDTRIVTFNAVGARDSGVVTLQLMNQPVKSSTSMTVDTASVDTGTTDTGMTNTGPHWKLESERTRFDKDG